MNQSVIRQQTEVVNLSLATQVASEFCVPACVPDGTVCVVCMDRDRKEVMRLPMRSESEAITVTLRVKDMILAAIERYERLK